VEFANRRERCATSSPEYLWRCWRYSVKYSVLSVEIERIFAVSRVFKVIRSHREASRTRRQLNRAISNATTPAMRDELIMVAQRNGNVL
jgi:hypothetical protein